MKELYNMDNELIERLYIKAFSKISTLEINIKNLMEDIKYGSSNDLISIESLELCLNSEKRELDIWKLIFRLTENERKRITEMV